MKGKNVLLDENLNPLICDFGLSKVLETEHSQTSNGLKGDGTLQWMAPELMDESGTKTMASDIYALGMTIVEVRVSITGNNLRPRAYWLSRLGTHGQCAFSWSPKSVRDREHSQAWRSPTTSAGQKRGRIVREVMGVGCPVLGS